MLLTIISPVSNQSTAATAGQYFVQLLHAVTSVALSGLSYLMYVLSLQSCQLKIAKLSKTLKRGKYEIKTSFHHVCRPVDVSAAAWTIRFIVLCCTVLHKFML